ncbi:F-box domain containing protein [Pandoravirus quercus]|nr:F-box domain containing protein [Pandoravirus quercus]AVK74986.1 F-box domain containing protein [Pandoravirus quercus]
METDCNMQEHGTHRRASAPPANDHLPNEILGLVFGWLQCVDRRVRAAVVCRTWRLVALDDGAVGRRSCARKRPPCFRSPAFYAAKSAAKVGHGDCMRRIFAAHPMICDPLDEIPKAAARPDCVDHFVCALKQCRADDQCAIAEAASYGASRVLAHTLADSWIDPRHALWAMRKAIANGHVECVRVLAPHCRDQTESMVEVAALGTASMIDILVGAGHPLHASACATAALWGRFDMLCHLRLIGCPWDARTCAYAIRTRRLDILAYARDNGCPWDAQSCAAAVAMGQHQLLAQLRDAGCPWDATVCAAAASCGDVDALVRLQHDGCPMSEAVCEDAAANGHLAILTYAHEHGCPWSTETINAAGFALCRVPSRYASVARVGPYESDPRDAGRIACIAYANTHGCPSNGQVVNWAVEAGDFGTLVRAHRAGCGWSARTTALAAAAGRNAMVIYAHENGCPWSVQTVPAAAARGALNILRYALAHGCPYDETEAIEAAREGGQWPCIALLLWSALSGDACGADV